MSIWTRGSVSVVEGFPLYWGPLRVSTRNDESVGGLSRARGVRVSTSEISAPPSG